MDVAAYISTCKVRPTRAWQCREAPARKALQPSVTLLASAPLHPDISTRWLFWIMRPNGRVRREREKKKSSFSGCLRLTWKRHLFSSVHLPLMQNCALGNRGTIKPACCSYSQSPVSLWNGTTQCHLYTGPILPKLIPIWPSSMGPSKGAGGK